MKTMACIPVRDTRPERRTLAAIRRVYGGHITTHAALPGRPDAVLPEVRVAILTHGCYWHHHEGCRHARIPQTGYPWASKFLATRARDLRVRAELTRLGLRTLWVWECAVVGPDALPRAELDQRIAGFV